MKKKIEELTPAQTARFPEFVERWTQIGLSTDPADRPRAEAAIREMYAVAGLRAPMIVWCGSPLSQSLTRAIILDKKLMKNIGHDVWDSVRDSVRASVGASVGASVWDSVWASVRASVRASVGDSVWDSVRASMWDSVRASVYGQHDAGWLAFYRYFRDALELTDQTENLSGLWELAQSAGWALPHQNICWVSERHNVLARDERGRLHSVSGPSVMYPDGWAIYAVHGVRIPAAWIEDRATLTPKIALTWRNVEQRRAACELLGWERILRELDVVIIDKDTDEMVGELVEVTIPNVGREKFLRVLCGTGRRFALPVPPTMKTALEANAWTYNIEPDVLKLLEART